MPRRPCLQRSAEMAGPRYPGPPSVAGLVPGGLSSGPGADPGCAATVTEAISLWMAPVKWFEPIGARILPANFGPLKGFNAHARIEGTCGDTMEFWCVVEDGTIHRVSFTTDGCETSLACGSLVAHLSEGKAPAEMARVRPIDVLEHLDAADNEEAHHCADLALRTLARALAPDRRAASARP